MSFVSYAQNFEDVMLWRALKHVKEGFYIDVGAHDPVAGSVTNAFYERGWRGINLEPIESPYMLLKAARARDINLQICAGAHDGTIDIYDVLPSGLATTQVGIAEEYKKLGHIVNSKQVPVKTLNNICKEYVTGEIHFLKIDVEGFEKEVLQGADFKAWRPWIVVIEATYPNSSKENFTSWEHFILNARYKFAYFDGLNRFYVASEHEELLSFFNTPPNYFDEFALSSSCFFSRLVAGELRQVESKAQQAEVKAQRAEAKVQQAEAKVQQAEAKVQQAEAKVQQAEAKVQQAEVREGKYFDELQAVYKSISWRITAPLRKLSLLHKHLITGISAWVRFRRGSRPRRIAVIFARRIYVFINTRPALRNIVLPIISCYPRLYHALRNRFLNLAPKKIHREDIVPSSSIDFSKSTSDLPLSAPAQRYYQQLFRDSSDKRDKG